MVGEKLLENKTDGVEILEDQEIKVNEDSVQTNVE
jgi:hypothetical protein